MPSEVKNITKALFKELKNKSLSQQFYNLLEKLTFELKILNEKSLSSTVKKFTSVLPLLLTRLVEEPKETNRLVILAFLKVLPLELLPTKEFSATVNALLEAIHWDTCEQVREEAAKILFDHLFLTRKIHLQREKAQTFFLLLFEQSSSLEEIFQNESNCRIKIRLAVLSSLLAKVLFGVAFQELPLKMRVAVFRQISGIIVASFRLTVLDHPWKILFENLPLIFTAIKEELSDFELKSELIDTFLSSLLDAHESLPLVYQESHLQSLYQTASFLGEQFATKIILKFLQLLTTTSKPSLQTTLQGFLDKLAQQFNYGYRSKLIAYYEPLLHRLQENLGEGSELSLVSSIPRNCFWCGSPIESQEEVCPSCGKELLRCVVCKLPISFEDEVGACSYCESKAHLVHFQEWVKTQGKCPACLRELPLEGIVVLSKSSK